MQPVQKPLDHRAGDQLEIVDLGEQHGIEVLMHQIRAAEAAFGLRAAGFSQPGQPRDPISRGLGRTAFGADAHRSAFLSAGRDDFDQPADQVFGVDSLGPGVKIEHQAMAQDGQGDRANVGEIDVKPAGENRHGLGTEDQVLRGPRAGAVGQELLDARIALGPRAGRVASARSTA